MSCRHRCDPARDCLRQQIFDAETALAAGRKFLRVLELDPSAAEELDDARRVVLRISERLSRLYAVRAL